MAFFQSAVGVLQTLVMSKLTCVSIVQERTNIKPGLKSVPVVRN